MAQRMHGLGHHKFRESKCKRIEAHALSGALRLGLALVRSAMHAPNGNDQEISYERSYAS